MSYWTNFGERWKSNPLGFIADPFNISFGLADKLTGNNQKNPSEAANPWLEKIPQTLQENLGHYVEQGKNPVGSFNEIAGQFEQSPYYKMMRDEALQAAANTAAAGGMRGSFQDMTNQSRIANALLGREFQQWYNNLSGIQNRGYEAAQNLSGDLSNYYGMRGGLEYQNQANQNRISQDQLQMLLSLLGMVGGGIAGGPGGAMAGGRIGGQLGQMGSQWM